MERDLIRWIRKRLPPHPLLRLGPGDDAAVLDMAKVDQCVITVDMLTDGVDFELSKVDPRRVGRKCLAVNLSDLAAMAARPLAAVAAVALPRQGGMELAGPLCEGMFALAEQYDVAFAGGDTNSWDGPLCVSVTLLGAVTIRGPLRRAGAKPGDRIIVTGSFGGSILGRHLDFEPRVGEALLLNERYELHAGIDVSDGLSLDLSRVIEESGCGAVVNAAAVPLAAAARQLADSGADIPVCRKRLGLRDRQESLPHPTTPLDHALGDGEDFELILAVPPAEAKKMLAEQPLSESFSGRRHGGPVLLTDIGEFIAEPGLWQIDANGIRRPLAPRGWEHQFVNIPEEDATSV